MSQVIPDSWVNSKLEDVVDSIVGGGTPSKAVSSYFQGDIPWMSVKDMNKNELVDTVDHISQEAVENSSTNVIPAGTPIVATRMSLGKIVTASFDSAINQDLKALFVNLNVEKPYLVYWYRSIANLIESLGTGTTVKGIRLEILKGLEFPLPPLAEQKVIADKLDELLAQVESTKARLDAIPTILKLFRQAVLAAAVSGELVAEKPKYREYDLSDISEKITDGEHITPKTLSHGIPLLSAKDVQENELLFENVKYVSREVADKAISRCNPEFGDILVVSRGATVGRTHLVKIDDEFCLMGSVLLIKLNQNIVMSEYMELVFKDSNGQKQLIATSGSSAQQAIYIRDVKSFKLELPSKSIQNEIVRRVEELFAFADKVEAQVNAAQTRVNNLTQSILAKAFRGELTQEWRTANPELICGENSAQALLERIKAERKKLKPAKNARAKKAKV
ncbi:restriction endonuclease subunit S [Shewanella inventionis]|uniref:Type-1 restriction enzyme EcoKI specificity protein n=1 Tax=Shewanella inventionis TaxID=1738770 RepID=A0ABQ1JX85_9GAMM|nr:restriction endonuclease subunit S [Shewanella inventionis]MCL1160039.1 restriction endonuclease subunit S [Shewanella inventionis]GGB76844.1 type-1 restriction enzyme EcoKI specificity protein [Shewanella inventionis]